MNRAGYDRKEYVKQIKVGGFTVAQYDESGEGETYTGPPNFRFAKN